MPLTNHLFDNTLPLRLQETFVDLQNESLVTPRLLVAAQRALVEARKYSGLGAVVS